jgi:anti-sigma regulatory factor (Ser/Thr protein kinase)
VSHSVFAVPSIALEMPAEPRSVALARRQVLRFAEENGADPFTLRRIAVSVSEAVTNAIVHAYAQGFDGLVHVEADFEDGDLEIVVLDDGDGFAPGETAGYGLGLGVIAGSADALLLRNRIPSGTEVWMRFGVGRAA